MITIEEKLKNLILSQYKSIREFTLYAQIANSTFDSMMRRGIQNANVTNVIKVCNALHISADALAEGKITSIKTVKKNKVISSPLQLEDIVKNFKAYLLSHDLTLEGEILDTETIDEFNRFIDLGIDFITRR